MNMHLPRTDVTKAELKELTLSTQHLISPSSSQPIVFVVQDTLVGSYLFSQPSVKLEKDEIFNLMMYNREFVNDLAKGQTAWSSKDVFSMILPKTFSFEQYGLKIVNGKMIDGRLDKSILGNKADSLLQNIHNMYSPEACKNFLNNIQDIITLWLSYNGFSIGVGDAMPTKKIRKQVSSILDEKLGEAWELVQELHQGIYQPDLAEKYLESMFEADIMNILGEANNMVETVIMDNISKDNRFYKAFKSGSKGKASNIKMIMGNIGQQTIWGKRIPEKFTNRTLPHFNKFDCGPIARGFVKHSFIGGLTPSEVFFHAMDGRTGLIDTAVKTAKSGYVQRRLVKAMEDLKVEYDGTVRNAEGNIVQFVYGEDNMDPVKIERTKLKLIGYDNGEMEKIYKFDVDMDDDSWNEFMEKGAVVEMKKNKDWKKVIADEYDRVLGYREELRHKYFVNQATMLEKIMTPVNYYRLITASLYKFSVNKYDKSELTPTEVIKKVDELCDLATEYLRDKDGMLMFKILTRSSLSSKQCIQFHRMSRIAFNEIIETAKKKVLDAFIQPGEMVGPLAAQSIGEPSTQLTLNSVDYESDVVVYGVAGADMVTVGKYIDDVIDSCADRSLIEKHDGGETTLCWTKDKGIKIMSVDDDGKVGLRQIEAVTRHLPKNKDGSSVLLKVKTKMGREVIATKAKSFLVRSCNKIVKKEGDELKIGDYVPVVRNVSAVKDDNLDVLDLTNYLSKTEYIYGSDFQKAKELMKNERFWYKKYSGKEFTLPFKRSDSITASKGNYEKGYVYYNAPSNITKIPVQIPLNYNFGFFIGAYLAEGLATETYVCISNNDANFRKYIEDFCKSMSIGYHTVVQENKIKEGWTSTDIRIHSKLMATLMKMFCKTGSQNKIVPSFAYKANDEFIKGMMNGYFSGDGCISKKQPELKAVSISKKMLFGISTLLNRFNIFSKIATPKKVESNNRGSKNIKQHYELVIRNIDLKYFADVFTSVIDYKQDRLDKYNKREYKLYSGKYDVIPGIDTGDDIGDVTLHKSEVAKMIETEDNSVVRSIYEDAFNTDLYYDEIVSIEEVESSHKYVYDFTVEGTRKFVMADGLCQYDTFHLSGHAGKSSVTSTGVPRLEEIINLYKTIKTPSTNIYLKPEYAAKMERAQQVKNKIEYTKLEHIVESTEILHEELDSLTSKDEDFEFIQTYYDFNSILKVDNNTDETLSKWVLRVIFDKESMLNKNIVISDVQEAIRKRCDTENEIQTIFSDDNSGNIVLRLKVRSDGGDSNDLQFMKEWEKNIVNITLRGIPLYNSYDPSDIGVGMYETNRIVYNEDGSYAAVKEWTLDTKGINLVDIMAFEEVDQKRTLSNDFYECYEIFGILGVRNMLISEINTVLSSEGVNYRHLTMLADTMTYKGHMMPISRHGINRSADYGPIGKCSFEEMTDMLLKSGTFAETDNMQGSSANVMMGQFVKAGTNAFDLMLDEEALMGGKGVKKTGYEDGESDDESDEETESEREGHEIEAEIDEMYDEANAEFDAHHDDFGINLNLNQQHKLGIIDEDTEVRISGKKSAVAADSDSEETDDESESDEEETDDAYDPDDVEDESVESDESGDESDDESEDESDDDEVVDEPEEKPVKKKVTFKKKVATTANVTKPKKTAVKKLIIKPKGKGKK